MNGVYFSWITLLCNPRKKKPKNKLESSFISSNAWWSGVKSWHSLLRFPPALRAVNCCNNNNIYYYMEASVLLGTKPLVDSIHHFIRDPSGVFSVCHLCECHIVQWHHDSRLLLLLNCFLTSRLLFRIKAWREGLRPSAKKKLKSLQKNLKTRTRRRIFSVCYKAQPYL